MEIQNDAITAQKQPAGKGGLGLLSMYKLKIIPCRFEYENNKKHELHQYTFEYSEAISQSFMLLFEFEVENYVMVY